ncbi:MAG: hypothetical protein HXY18_01155 [Bryobacteraceae bacterium]|nr:hypothetical protein [Bryobacteraceae bacterium]
MFERFGLSREEYARLRALKTPERIQAFLDCDIAYNLEPSGPTCYSPRVALRKNTSHCMEGALLAAAALRVLGYPPLILDLESVRDDDHVVAVYKARGCWGAVAKSDYSGLRIRDPVYRTLRELVMTYFPHYYNLKGEKTLRAYSTRPVNLAKFDKRGWMTSEEDVWYIPESLYGVHHTRLLTAAQERALKPMDRRLFEAGRHGGVAH